MYLTDSITADLSLEKSLVIMFTMYDVQKKRKIDVDILESVWKGAIKLIPEL